MTPTPRQLILLRAIWGWWQEKGYGPNFREIADRMGVSSTNGITEGLNRLQREGWLVRENLVPRSVRVTRRGAEAAGIEVTRDDVGLAG